MRLTWDLNYQLYFDIIKDYVAPATSIFLIIFVVKTWNVLFKPSNCVEGLKIIFNGFIFVFGIFCMLFTCQDLIINELNVPNALIALVFFVYAFWGYIKFMDAKSEKEKDKEIDEILERIETRRSEQKQNQ